MLKTSLYLSAALFTSLIVLVVGFLINAAWPAIQDQGIGLFTHQEWYPYEQLFGLLPAIIGSLWVVAFALIIAIPLGLSAALLHTELLPPQISQWSRLTLEILTAVPSVVYGLIGLWVLLPLLEQHLGLLTGHSLLAAALLLALMILPTLTLLLEDALRGVSSSQIDTAKHLGLDWSRRLTRILIPQAWPGIRVAILLAMGRAMGETIAVMLVVGSINRLPDPWYNLLQPAQTLTSQIGREMSEASIGSLHWSALMSGGLVLAMTAIFIASLTRIRHTSQ